MIRTTAFDIPPPPRQRKKRLKPDNKVMKHKLSDDLFGKTSQGLMENSCPFLYRSKVYHSATDALYDYMKDFDRRPLCYVRKTGEIVGKNKKKASPGNKTVRFNLDVSLPTVTDLLASDVDDAEDGLIDLSKLENLPRNYPQHVPKHHSPSLSISPIKPSPFDKLTDLTSPLKTLKILDLENRCDSLLHKAERLEDENGLDTDDKEVVAISNYPSWINDICETESVQDASTEEKSMNEACSAIKRPVPEWVKQLQNAEVGDVLGLLKQRLELKVNDIDNDNGGMSDQASTISNNSISTYNDIIELIKTVKPKTKSKTKNRQKNRNETVKNHESDSTIGTSSDSSLNIKKSYASKNMGHERNGSVRRQRSRSVDCRQPVTVLRPPPGRHRFIHLKHTNNSKEGSSYDTTSRRSRTRSDSVQSSRNSPSTQSPDDDLYVRMPAPKYGNLKERSLSWSSLTSETTLDKDSISCTKDRKFKDPHKFSGITEQLIAEVLGREKKDTPEIFTVSDGSESDCTSSKSASVITEIYKGPDMRPLERLKNLLFTVQSLDQASDDNLNESKRMEFTDNPRSELKSVLEEIRAEMDEVPMDGKTSSKPANKREKVHID